MIPQPPELVRGLPPEDAASVLVIGVPVALAAGDVLFDLGTDAESLYLIQRGRIALTLPMRVADCEKDIVVEEHVPGQMLGWSALVPPHRFTLKATAQLPSEVLAFRRSELLAYCAVNTKVGQVVALNIAEVIGRRLQVFQAMWLRQMQRVVTHVHA